MLVRHKKVSGQANGTDATKVGGADWDADHGLAFGSQHIFKFLKLTHDTPDLFASPSGLSGTTLSKVGSGQYQAVFAEPAAGVIPATATWDYTAVLLAKTGDFTGLTVTVQAYLGDPGFVNVDVTVSDGGGNVDPTGPSTYTILVMLTIAPQV